MLRVFAAPDIARVHGIREMLAKNEIPAVVRGDKLSEQLPSYKEIWPSVWIERETDAARALKLLAEVNPKNELCNLAWACIDCGSSNPAGSALCHSCLERQTLQHTARVNSAQASAALLLKISAAFFFAFLIAYNLSPRLIGWENQHGADVFAILSCVSSIVLVIWALLEFSRTPQ